MELQKNDRREIFGWLMYDWANSAFYTTVIGVLIAPYLTSLAQAAVGENGIVLSFGALGSVTAIIAGILIVSFGWLWADAVCSVLISMIIIFGSWNLIRDSANVLLEGTPRHINLAAVEDVILQTEGVNAVHDLHIWTITSGMEALSAHVRHDEKIAQHELLKRLRNSLHDEFGIDHLTIQMETPEFEDEDVHFCQTGANCFESDVKVKAFTN